MFLLNALQVSWRQFVLNRKIIKLSHREELGIVVKMTFRIPASYIEVTGPKLSSIVLGCDTSFLLMQTVEGSDDGSSK